MFKVFVEANIQKISNMQILREYFTNVNRKVQGCCKADRNHACVGGAHGARRAINSRPLNEERDSAPNA